MEASYDLDTLQERIGYRFAKEGLLLQALTHASFANETSRADSPDYERLEFLGDAVLEMVSSEFLFNGHPEMREGDMSRMRASLVCEDALYQRAEAIGLKHFIRLGKGEEKTGGRERPSIISDVMEALIGAMFLDGGIDATRQFILRDVLTPVDEDAEVSDDYKTTLQEIVQSQGRNDLRYEVLSESGPDHNKRFRTAVYLGDECLGTGEGSSKRKAQQKAAHRAIESISQGLPLEGKVAARQC